MFDGITISDLCAHYPELGDIYEKLMDAETGLYRESPSYVFGLLQDEINFGHIVQAEV